MTTNKQIYDIDPLGNKNKSLKINNGFEGEITFDPNQNPFKVNKVEFALSLEVKVNRRETSGDLIKVINKNDNSNQLRIWILSDLNWSKD